MRWCSPKVGSKKKKRTKKHAEQERESSDKEEELPAHPTATTASSPLPPIATPRPTVTPHPKVPPPMLLPTVASVTHTTPPSSPLPSHRGLETPPPRWRGQCGDGATPTPIIPPVRQQSAVHDFSHIASATKRFTISALPNDTWKCKICETENWHWRGQCYGCMDWRTRQVFG